MFPLDQNLELIDLGSPLVKADFLQQVECVLIYRERLSIQRSLCN